MNVSIQISEAADEAVRERIRQPLIEYNLLKTKVSDYRPLALVVSDDSGSVIGGLWGRTAYSWLFTELLFVPEALRGQGIGRDLMLRAEEEALVRGCHSAWLDTYEFQARGFYERMGYQCFAELPDYPPGFGRYFMKKALSRWK